MKRRLFTTLAAMSFILCMATIAVWTTNMWRPTFFGPRMVVGDLSIYGERSQTAISWTPKGSSGHWHYWSGPYPPTLSNTCTWHVAGFGLDRPQGDGSICSVIPSWFIVAATIPLPIAWRIRSRRTSKQGLCPTCGYDLRATPNRCPECGKITQTLNK